MVYVTIWNEQPVAIYTFICGNKSKYNIRWVKKSWSYCPHSNYALAVFNCRKQLNSTLIDIYTAVEHTHTHTRTHTHIAMCTCACVHTHTPHHEHEMQDGSLKGRGNSVILKGNGSVRRSFLGTFPSVQGLCQPRRLCVAAQTLIYMLHSLVACTSAWVEHTCVHTHVPIWGIDSFAWWCSRGELSIQKWLIKQAVLSEIGKCPLNKLGHEQDWQSCIAVICQSAAYLSMHNNSVST